MSKYQYNRNFKKWFIFSSTVFFLIVVIIATNNNSKILTFGENAISYVVTPINRVFYYSTTKSAEFVRFLFGSHKDRIENEKLQIENQRLKEQVDKMNNVISNESFLKNEYKILTVSKDIITDAYITSKEGSNLFDKFNINKGSNNKVKNGDIIVQGVKDKDKVIKGLVGVVTETNINNAKVKTILDDHSSISFRTAKSNEVGILKTSTANVIEGYMYDENPKVQKGDAVYTSGLGGVYPSNIYIGEIIEVKKSDDKLRTIIKVRTPIHFNSLYRVLVIPKEGVYEEKKE